MTAIAVQPLIGAEFDNPAEVTVRRTQTYVVCSTPRSGSGLLCRGLGATGIAGAPLEYFHPAYRALLSRRWGCGSDLRANAEALQVRRTSRTGVLGTKLHWHQLEAVHAEAQLATTPGAQFEQCAGLVEELLGARPSYVRVVRRVVHRQAVSLWTAEHTGAWSRTKDDAGPAPRRVPYSFAGIRRCLERIAIGEVHWDRFFRLEEVHPVEVTYEELSSDYAGAVARVLQRLVPDARAEIAPPITVRQADERSEELLERFLADLSRARFGSPSQRARLLLVRALPRRRW